LDPSTGPRKMVSGANRGRRPPLSAKRAWFLRARSAGVYGCREPCSRVALVPYERMFLSGLRASPMINAETGCVIDARIPEKSQTQVRCIARMRKRGAWHWHLRSPAKRVIVLPDCYASISSSSRLCASLPPIATALRLPLSARANSTPGHSQPLHELALRHGELPIAVPRGDLCDVLKARRATVRVAAQPRSVGGSYLLGDVDADRAWRIGRVARDRAEQPYGAQLQREPDPVAIAPALGDQPAIGVVKEEEPLQLRPRRRTNEAAVYAATSLVSGSATTTATVDAVT
jgi:hypothetical protein